MKRSNSGYTSYFDPLEWDAASETAHPAASYFTFQRGRDLATQWCLKSSRVGDSWLDAGCGTGQLAAELARHGRLVWGLDHDQRMIERARTLFPASPFVPAPQFIVGAVDRLPFPDCSLDGMVITSVLGCLANPEMFYVEASRALKKGGTLISTVTNRQSLLLRFNYLFRKKETTRFHLYSMPEVSESLHKNQFQIETILYYNFFLSTQQRIFPSPAISGFLDRLGPSPWRRHLARNFLVLARRNYD
jgi:ubiquinone/menaquinone biosynthesis C-methylase UbiE